MQWKWWDVLIFFLGLLMMWNTFWIPHSWGSRWWISVCVLFTRVCVSFIKECRAYWLFPTGAVRSHNAYQRHELLCWTYDTFSYQLQHWNPISLPPWFDTLLIVGFICCVFSLVQMLSKQILQQVKWCPQLFRTSGNASLKENMELLSL